jgi:mono/diheme cytochrome c family protein
LGAEANDRYLGGGDIDGWHAPALNAASPAPQPWTREELVGYLRNGFVPPHGVAAGPMQPVANNLGAVAEQDVKAIAAYIGAMLGPATAGRRGATRPPGAPGAQAAPPPAPADAGAAGEADGAVIYAGACALCHEPTGQTFSAHGIPLMSSKVVAMPDARNLSHVILEGIDAPKATPAALMPGFGAMLSDRQIAALMAYLRTTFSQQPAWSGLEDTVRAVRQSARGP